MRTRISDLRICLVMAALSVAGAAAGCSEGSNPTRPAEVAAPATTASPGRTSPSPAAADGSFPVSAQLAAVRRATARFHDISAAYAAGYTTENEPCVSSPQGAMGFHAPNLALIADQNLDPTKPELLLYAPSANGGFRLVGVEYFQAILLRNTQTNEVGPWFSPDRWPAHYEVINPRPQLFGQAFHETPPPVPHVPWHWSLHAWIWAHNPSGMFADWNPALSCN